VSEASAIYTGIVDSLFMLDRDLRVSHSVDDISNAVKKYGVNGLLSRSRIPIPIQVSLENLTGDESTMMKVLELCEDGNFSQGRELQRIIYKGFDSLCDLSNGKKIISHLAENTNGSKGLGKILGALNLVAHDPEFNYPFDLHEENSILRNLRTQLTDKSVKRLELDDRTLDRYVERIESDEKFERIGKIATTLAGYSHFQNDQQIGLLREIVTAELDGNSKEWKYSHNRAEEQLRVLDGKIESWKNNATSSRLVGDLEGLSSHVDAVRDAIPKILEVYNEHYESTFNGGVAVSLELRISQNENKLRDGKLSGPEKREVGHETSLLREQLGYTNFIRRLQNLSTDNYQDVLEEAETFAKKRSKNPLNHNAVWVRDVLDQPVYRDARKISIVETDDLETVLRMGEIPIPVCQNWKIDSSYNGSLLSFVADANKKLYHIVNGNDKPIGMSSNMLLDWERDPTILITNIYANEWSEDYGIALMGSLADKAAAVAEETGKPTRLAVPYHSGHEGHKTNVQVREIFEKFAELYKVDIGEGRIDITLPESKNMYEYVDCGPGKIRSGSRINVDVKYITFGRD